MVEENEAGGGATGATTAMVNGIDVKPTKDQQDDETSFRHQVERLLLCTVCHDTVTDPRQLNCGHFLCFECVELLTVDEAVRCAKCSTDTPVTAAGIRVDELAARLLLLLDEFGPQTRKALNGTDLAFSAPTNGVDKYMDEDDEPLSEDEQATTNEAEEEATDTVAAPADVDPPPADDDNVVTEVPTDIHVAPVIHTNADTPAEGDADVDTTPTVVVDEAQEVDKQLSADPVEVIIEPPEYYQSLQYPSTPGGAVNEAEKVPVQHDTTQTEEEKVENTDAAAEVKEEPVAEDETDHLMKASEMKPSDVAMSIETERQCGDCHSSKCTCNVSLLTPPVSNGSQLSVETNASNNPSEDEDMEISVKQIAKFQVPEGASHIEVANRNRVYVTRWTYDDKGAVGTFDSSGNKIKFIHSGRYNFSGIAISKLGFVFVLNTNKQRIEEYGGVDGKKVKHVKLELCRDPHAVDIMPTGEILVIDQEKNRVIVYPNSKRGSSRPKILTNALIKDPHDIASCPEGFYITCTASKYLLKMDLEGNIIWKYNGQSSESEKRSKILQGVCVDESGDVYVVDKDNDAIMVFTSDGELKGRIKVRERFHKTQRPWYVSVRDGVVAILFSHNIVKTLQLV